MTIIFELDQFTIKMSCFCSSAKFPVEFVNGKCSRGIFLWRFLPLAFHAKLVLAALTISRGFGSLRVAVPSPRGGRVRLHVGYGC